MNSKWIQGLNPEQSEAVLHDFGPLLILAGAGSGKTTVLVSRAGRLVANQVCSPEKLCVLTFTNKAARELKDRVSRKLGDLGKKIWAGTFHSFGLYWLRKYYKEVGLTSQFSILDPSDATHLLKELLKDLHIGDKTAYDGDKLLKTVSRFREKGIVAAPSDDEYEVAAEWLLPRYLQKMKQLSVVDFDSLLLLPLKIMKENETVCQEMQQAFDQIMIDEFQDTNDLQMNWVRKLVAQSKNLTVVGDDDQSIYGWRGAQIKNILGFPKIYPEAKVIKLEWNYRSTATILNLANSVIGLNKERHPKTLKATQTSIEQTLPEFFEFQNETEEAENVVGEIVNLLNSGRRGHDIAILFRTNQQGAFLEAELRRQRVAYSMRGGMQFLDRKESRDILAYLKCLLSQNEISFRRILNVPPRGIGEKTFEKVEAFAEMRQISFVPALFRYTEIDLEPKQRTAIEKLIISLAELKKTFQNPSTFNGSQLLSFLENLGYRQYLENMSSESLGAYRKWQFVEIFCNIFESYLAREGRDFHSLKHFIESLELRDIVESEKDLGDKVQLLTLHACKGLEFPVVFLIGLEEDILPHKKLGFDLAEERRLFYVGVTRAKEKLILTRSKQRFKNGREAPSPISRFLLEVPKELYISHQGGRSISVDKRKEMLKALFQKLDAPAP